MTAKDDRGRTPAAPPVLSTDGVERVLIEPRPDDAPVARRVTVAGLVVRSWTLFALHVDVFLMLMWRPFAVSAAAAWGAVELVPEIGVTLAAQGYMLVTMIAVIPVVTAWHRMILLGDDNPRASITYRIGAAEWTYLKAAITLYGLGYAVALGVEELYGPLLGGPLLWLVQEGFDPGGWVTRLAPTFVHIIAVAVILGVLVARFFLVLPAAALGVPMSYVDSAVATRGNGLKLVLAYVISSIPPAILTFVFVNAETVLVEQADEDTAFLALVLAIIPRILLYTIAVGILSLAFETLVGVPRRLRRRIAVQA
ncbi:MAG: hypothetical protein VYB54_07855 [Pseudomonadota bacterium]|nr:hypothetical protein [Pseudomonadota bacterium]